MYIFDSVIFDLDGVIVDTVPLHFLAWEKFFKHHNINFTMEMYFSRVDGKARSEGIKSILGNIDENKLKEFANLKQKYFLEFLEKIPVKVFGDALKLIKELKKHNIKLGIASSSKNTERILKRTNLLKYFDSITTGNDIKNSKPHPEIFQTAAEKLKSTNPIVIEDSIAGIQAAKNAGFFCIGINRKNDEILNKANITLYSLNLDFNELIAIYKRAI